jgi:YidC/Oxa1 family membrane protein insertase
VRSGSPAATHGTREATTLSAEPRPRRRLIGLAAAATLLLLLLFSPVVLAQSPSPTTSFTPAPTATLVPTTSPAPSSSPTPSPAQSSATPAPSASPGASAAPCPLPTPLPTAPAPGATPYPHALCPAEPTGDPLSLLGWLFNPIFQTMFLALTVFYVLLGDIGIAIILLTLLIKTILIPLFRQQLVSQRRMQMLQPEIRAINVKFKGNRSKISEETMRLYRERGVNPAAGCLPSFLQLFLLLPIYYVISQGLAAPDISSAMQFLGQPVLNVVCQAPGTLQPCLDTHIHWLFGLDAHLPEILFAVPVPILGSFGVSALAFGSAFLQLIQTRMMSPAAADPQQASQQRLLLFLPLIAIFYGSFLPAGLFIYWIVSTAYSIVQQYLIVGWGSLFPLFGWTPGFARDHTPRFPVPIPVPQRGDDRDKTDARPSATDRAAGTIRPARQRGRTSRRGRRR